MINLVNRRVGPAAVIALAVAAAPTVRAGDRHHDSDDNRYVVNNLTSDIAALKISIRSCRMPGASRLGPAPLLFG